MESSRNVTIGGMMEVGHLQYKQEVTPGGAQQTKSVDFALLLQQELTQLLSTNWLSPSLYFVFTS